MSKVEELLEQLCPDGVIMKEVREIARIINGYAFKSSKYVASGIRVIRISDVQKGKMSDKDLKFYPIELTDEIKNYLLKENDLVMSLTGNVGRVAMLSQQHLPSGLNQRVACVRPNSNEVLTRFLFHFFDQNNFETDAMINATGGGQKNMSTTWLSKYKIPLPPLPIQQEIVSILDKFTTLDAELEIELEARRTQYKHYRDQLLCFEGKEVEWKMLGEVGEFIRGRRFVKDDIVPEGVPCIHYGELYTHYNIWAKEAKSFLNADLAAKLRVARKGDVVIVSAGETIEDIGNGVAWLGDSDVVIHDACFAYRHSMNPKYVSYYLQTNLFRSQIKKYISSGKISSINSPGLSKAKIPIPPMEEQERIVKILDKFNALVNDISVGIPAEIKARRKQYEYYRGKLLNFKNISHATE